MKWLRRVGRLVVLSVNFGVLFTIICPAAWWILLFVPNKVWGWQGMHFPSILYPLCWTIPAVVAYAITANSKHPTGWRRAAVIALLTSVGAAAGEGATWPVWLRGAPPMEVRWSMAMQHLGATLILFVPFTWPTAKCSLTLLARVWHRVAHP